MQGVARFKVKLVPHDISWQNEYRKVRQELLESWPDNILDIQHVGSTAIIAIKAKPILDVAVRVSALDKINIAALENIGYEYCGWKNETQDYCLFVLRSEDNRSLRHIHVYGPDQSEFFCLSGFRDYLNSHPEEAEEYNQLKEKLSEMYPDDRIAYTKGKEAFIHSIYEKLEIK